jgi:uncharacterized membrane protein YfcA
VSGRGTGAGRVARAAVTGIAVTTMLTGAAQMVAPGAILRTVSGPESTADRHFFRIIGMFMTVVGGLLLDTQRRRDPDPQVLHWASLQKFGASAGVGVGVASGVFGPGALAIAAFDLSSAVLLVWYRRRCTRR